MNYKGSLFRALHPRYARMPLSGEGARRYGGRFNARGRAALYLTQDFATLRHEIAQGGSFQPSTIIEIEADIRGLFDACDGPLLTAHGMTTVALADPAWRLKMQQGRPVPTQDLAETLIAVGHCGMVVPSFARGAQSGGRNIVLWHWGDTGDARLRVIDDDGRIS